MSEHVRASFERPGGQGVRSQTLERALDVLQMLADEKRRTSQEIADALQLHRSIVYRILRTLEDYSFVMRGSDGRFTLGLGIASLAQASMGSVDVRIDEVLQELANATSTTAVFCTPQHAYAVVLASARPNSSPASIAVRTSTRFPLNSGAPGMAILSLAAVQDYERDEIALARRTHVVHTKGEPFSGLEAVAIPVRLSGSQMASVAVIFPIDDFGVADIVGPLRHAARCIETPNDSWTF